MRNSRTTFVGVVVSVIATLTVLSVTPVQAAPDKDREPSVTAPKDDSLAPDRGVDANVVAPPAAEAALAVIQSRIARYVAEHGTRYTFGSYLDPDTGRIVLNTNAPAKVVSMLTDLSGAGHAQQQSASQAQVRRTTTTDMWNRRDDIQPFYGGGGITLVPNTPWCTSGYAVRRSTGIIDMVTAGHCFPNGSDVLTEFGVPYGSVFDRYLDTRDMERIGGKSYAGRIFTGGPVSSTSAPVVAAGEAVVGYANYCHSGRTTGEQCGHTAISITAQVCTHTGCRSPIIAFTGGVLPQGGDSGAPFYAVDSNGGVWIRGHVLALGGGTGYAEKWTKVSSTYGVSIVTG